MAAGTAYLAWYGPESDAKTLRFCRLPRGAGACDTSSFIAAPGTTLSRPFVSVAGDTVRVVQYRYPLSGPIPPQVYEFTSVNRGVSFDAGHPVGYPPFEKTALARAEAGGLTDGAADRCDWPAGGRAVARSNPVSPT